MGKADKPIDFHTFGLCSNFVELGERSSGPSLNFAPEIIGSGRSRWEPSTKRLS